MGHKPVAPTEDEKRKSCIQFIAAVIVPQDMAEHLSSFLDLLDSETLYCAGDLASISMRLSEREAREHKSCLSGMIYMEESTDIRTVANHIDLIERDVLSLPAMTMLLPTLRELELMDSDAEEYDYFTAHAKLSRYSTMDRIPYHQNDELVKLVHEYQHRNDEVVNLIHRQGISDPGLIRVHLTNDAPALTDGLL